MKCLQDINSNTLQKKCFLVTLVFQCCCIKWINLLTVYYLPVRNEKMRNLPPNKIQRESWQKAWPKIQNRLNWIVSRLFYFTISRMVSCAQIELTKLNGVCVHIFESTSICTQKKVFTSLATAIGKVKLNKLPQLSAPKLNYRWIIRINFRRVLKNNPVWEFFP